MAALQWDLFCKVIDNHGDVGVCWRLAVDLARRGQRVRLWSDDRSALDWLAPQGADQVEVLPWPAESAHAGERDDRQGGNPGQVVIEAFGCELPTVHLAAMARMRTPPVWIDLEYLSAESYVERSHFLPSPQTSGPGAGLVKRFFYPGFSTATGGLIREPGLLAARQAFDAGAWLGRLGLKRRAGERIVSLFCYEQPALAALLNRLAQAPTLLLATHGAASRQVLALDEPAHRPLLRLATLPLLSQVDYDHLLWSCDLNFVRGEDSFVRAQWAGMPFVWQAYRQTQNHHLVKVQAFLERHLAGADRRVAGRIEQLWSIWNGGASAAALELPPADPWRQTCRDWRAHLVTQSDLSSRLMQFVAGVTARTS